MIDVAASMPEAAYSGSGFDRSIGRSPAARLITPALLALVLLGALVLGVTGNVVLAALPILAGLAAVGLWWLPVRVPLYAVLALGLLADVGGPVPIPASNPVLAPVRLLKEVLLENLNGITGVQALRVSGLDVMLLALTVLLCARAIARVPETLDASPPLLRPLLLALFAALTILVLAEVWGIGRGGDIRQSVWQIRYVLWVPLLSVLAMLVVRTLQHVTEIAFVLTGVALCKTAIGVYVYVWSLRHGHGVPHSVTSHADTMLFAVVVALWSAVLVLRPSAGRFLVGVPALIAMLVAIVANNRRTAYVSVGLALFLLLLHVPRRTLRRALLLLAALSPLFVGYMIVGASRSGGIFAPAAAIWSVTKQSDGSSDSRDVENYNLTLTLRGNLPLGSGFGHMYDEGPAAYDLSDIFAQFRYVAHNSILWLLAILGPLGFFMLWLPIVVGTYFAALAHRFADAAPRASTVRIAAYVVIATFAAYQVQAYSDMGTQGWTGTTLVALALATTAVLVRETGVWRVAPRAGGHA
ncbi:MAG: O-antigen ligase family protein [Gemmatimonadaceae bacterium]|nr:O-antigen ligase family protein [Gemmatimonadaceae bacterium]